MKSILHQNKSWVFSIAYTVIFLTDLSCTREDFYTPTHHPLNPNPEKLHKGFILPVNSLHGIESEKTKNLQIIHFFDR
jgi:hypothetical protein